MILYVHNIWFKFMEELLDAVTGKWCDIDGWMQNGHMHRGHFFNAYAILRDGIGLHPLRGGDDHHLMTLLGHTLCQMNCETCLTIPIRISLRNNNDAHLWILLQFWSMMK